MSRLARRESDSLLRSYIISLRLLTMLSLPIAVAVTFLAEPLVAIVGGAQYLNVPGVFHIFGYDIPYMGGADLAFQVIIWSIPIGFINSVTQYVLIAVNQQHFLTRAFLIGVVFNIGGNLLLIPALGYVGAALTTIMSEIILLFPFYYSVRRNVGVVPWLQVIGQPAIAAAVMAAGIYALIANGTNAWLAVAAGAVVYLGGLLVTGALRGEDMSAVLRALPIGPLKRMLPVQS
ncbi:MAG: polysaccharide biosynthesis C-terminal domain-containing protein [Anaerolineales bacterium]|nr:polysaccharide biosynthesis C-terminal domain-containing protein [Anaerolineales bacterium]